MFAASHSRTGFPHLRPRPLTSSISFRINTCKSVSKQTTLTLFRINTYEKHRGVGVLLLSTHPMRMRILSESAAADESKDLSSHPVRIAVLGSIARFLRLGWAYGATRDLSSHPMRMRILEITFFFASLFCAAAPFSPAFAGANRVPASAPDDAADLRSAKESFDAGDYVSARKTLQAALEKSPDDPEVHFWLGRCSYELFDFNSAVASFERAVQLQPKSSLYHQWLGRAYSEKADREHSLSFARKTKKEFQSAVHLDPANISAHRDLAEYEMDAPCIAGGDRDDARKQVEAISILDPIEGSLARPQYVFHVEKKPAQPEEIYRQGLPQKPPAHQTPF